MGTTIDISYWGLGIGMLLLLVPLYFFHHFKTGLVKPTIVGAIRMIVQLFLIGIYLKYLFLWDNPWINFLWVFIMVFVATETALSRTRLKRRILMGNMLSSNVIALNTFYSNLMREQQLYYYLLGNGATRHEATAPFVREAIIKAFSPAIANMAVMGLVALPGTMIGQILGGSSPNVAIKYQMMIIVITVAASILSLMTTLWLSARKTFDSYGCIRQVFKE